MAFNATTFELIVTRILVCGLHPFGIVVQNMWSSRCRHLRSQNMVQSNVHVPDGPSAGKRHAQGHEMRCCV